MLTSNSDCKIVLYISCLQYSHRCSCTVKMKVIFGVITFVVAVMVAGSAPMLNEGQLPGTLVEHRQESYRDKRSQYPQYLSPCAAAAASAPIPAIAPVATYPLNISPYHGYPQQYYAAPHYRSVEMEPEIMSFSDMDHMMSEHVPMARFGYPAPAPVAPHVYPPAATTGPVFGVFPNANSGGCNVPLLFSCTPSVVSGHVVQSPHYHAPANSYRGVDPLDHQHAHEGQLNQEEPVVHEHLTPAHDPNHAMEHQ